MAYMSRRMAGGGAGVSPGLGWGMAPRRRYSGALACGYRVVSAREPIAASGVLAVARRPLDFQPAFFVVDPNDNTDVTSGTTDGAQMETTSPPAARHFNHVLAWS